MATVTKDFRVKAGLVVEGSTATVAGKNIITAGVVDAKGDLIVGSADDAVARLGIGTNGQVLTAASGATYGVQWSDPAAVGSFASEIVFEGATANDFETTLTVTDPTADRTITFKDASGTVAFTSDIPSSTDGLSEGSTNKYFTDERAQDAIGNAVGTGITYNDTTGAISVDQTVIQARVTNVTDTEIGYLDGVTSSIQTQLGNKAAASDLTTHTSATEAHGATGAVVGTTNTQTLTNKTLTSPVVTGLTLNDSSIVFEGSSADASETTVTVTNPTADRTITLPDATGTVALTSDITTHANLTEAHGATGAVVGTTNTQTLSNKTFSDAVNLGGSGDFTFTGTNNIVFTAGAGSAVKVGANVITTKADKLNVFAATSSSELAGIISDETGTGALVFANTPTLVTPNIGAATGTSLVLSGDLTVNGTTTTINSTEITVDDKNLTLGSVASPTDAGADGGGITLKGATDKTFNWVDATDSWTSSEHLNLASGKELKIAGTTVLSGSTLGSGITGSSLTSVGTITSGTWNGTAIAIANGGTGSTSAGDARTALGLAIGTDVQAYNSTLAAVAGGTYTGDDSITTVGTISAGTWNGSTIAVANGGTGITSFGTGIATLLGNPSSANLAAAITDETGTGVVVFSNTPTLVTPVLGAATATSVGFADTLTGSATATAGTSATTIDTFSATTYTAAKYVIQMKKGTDIEVIEMLVAVDGSNNVYVTEYADVISNAELGTTNAVYSAGNVLLQVTAAAADTAVKVSKTYIKA